jgi:YHS domain-containing protein
MHRPFYKESTMKTILLFLSLFAAVLVFADEPPVATPETTTPDTAAPAAVVVPSTYAIDYCIVSGEKLGSKGEPVKYNLKGREIQLCSPACLKIFKKDPASYLAQLDQAIIESQRKNYPLSTCVVSGEKLGEMGKPYNYVYQNRLVRLCCSGCVETFNKDPKKYLKMIDDARTAAAPTPPSGDQKPTQK